MTGEDLFGELVEPLYADRAVQRSTMMGLPCVRYNGRFFASLERRSGALLVKVPPRRVAALIADGVGEPFAPAGRIFREWVALPHPDRQLWSDLLTEARHHAAGTPAEIAGFRGFGEAGLKFLIGLERDNTKRFFDTHRPVYRQELLEPAKAFVTALGQVLHQRVSAALHAEPRVGGSLFRIANDLRFAPDRPPYKPHLDFVFWEGPNGPKRDPALILRIGAAEILLGCGVMPRSGPALAAYRGALRDDARVADLNRHVTRLQDSGAELSEPTRRHHPAGFDPAGPAARFALRDGWHLVNRYPHPAEITTPALVNWCADRFVPFAPVHSWLTQADQTVSAGA
ncbi:DUF2461 family protein [Paractinoplanes rishiriensis]|nr:DUF2461 family protein [Actinoplanes rishiriensis]